MISIYFLQTAFFITSYCFGKLAIDVFNRNFNLNFNESSVFQCIIFFLFFVSTAVFVINFFLPINNFIQFLFSFFFLVSVIKKFKIKDKNLLFICLISFFLVPLTVGSTMGEDGGLYHVPFQTWIKDNNITVGLFNLHSRYALVPIHGYLSSLFSIDSFFILNSFLQSLTVLLFFLFFYEIFLTNKILLILIIPTLITFFVWQRYIVFGYSLVDFFFGVLSIFVTLKFLLFAVIKKNKIIKEFSFFLLLLIYAIMSKPSGIILIIFLPLLFITFPNKFNLSFLKQCFTNKFFYFLLLILLLWFVKNLIISSCLLYPLKISCFNTEWFNESYLNRDLLLIGKYKNHFSTFNLNWVINEINKNYIFIIPVIISILISIVTMRSQNIKFSYYLLIILIFLLFFTFDSNSLQGFSNLSTIANLDLGSNLNYIKRDTIILIEVFRLMLSFYLSILIVFCILKIYIVKKISFFTFNKNIIYSIVIILLFLLAWFISAPDPRLAFWIFAILPSFFCFLIIKDNIYSFKLNFNYKMLLLIILIQAGLFSYQHFIKLNNSQLSFFAFDLKNISKNSDRIVIKRKYFGYSPYKKDPDKVDFTWNYCMNVKNCYFNEDEADIKDFFFFKKIFIRY